MTFQEVIAYPHTYANGYYVFAKNEYDLPGCPSVPYLDRTCPYCGSNYCSDPQTITRAYGWWWNIYDCKTRIAMYNSDVILGTTVQTAPCRINSSYQDDSI